MEGFEKGDKTYNKNDVFSKSVRAGKRTYFFDVKSTKRNEYYLTITESKKRYDESGQSFFEKHKIFLYQEDFDNFMESFNEVISYIKDNQPEITPREEYKPYNTDNSDKENKV